MLILTKGQVSEIVSKYFNLKVTTEDESYRLLVEPEVDFYISLFSKTYHRFNSFIYDEPDSSTIFNAWLDRNIFKVDKTTVGTYGEIYGSFTGVLFVYSTELVNDWLDSRIKCKIYNPYTSEYVSLPTNLTERARVTI